MFSKFVVLLFVWFQVVRLITAAPAPIKGTSNENTIALDIPRGESKTIDCGTATVEIISATFRKPSCAVADSAAEIGAICGKKPSCQIKGEETQAPVGKRGGATTTTRSSADASQSAKRKSDCVNRKGLQLTYKCISASASTSTTSAAKGGTMTIIEPVAVFKKDKPPAPLKSVVPTELLE
ncbi:hypothetical protein BV898_10260 [Hypsibius exemplaris]|uniref:SUEL-type lectin domain-containing protein n=1 Tax=Hypsibius exemplaris TaxID=2072580 RepID=A0A1W0WJY9_HYPEX|nr:hypothetical protein BV898_10260 [Hypsibius exemplaris]